MTDDGSWRVLEERTVFHARPFVRVRQQTIGLPDGRIVDDYFRVDLGDYACVYPVTTDRRVVMLRQYSHGLGRVTLTFPAGQCAEGERPADTAGRELTEETGYLAGSLRLLARAVVDGNKRCGEAHLFLGLGCHRVAEPDSGDFERSEIVLMRRAEIMDAAARGDIAVLAHVALLALAPAIAE